MILFHLPIRNLIPILTSISRKIETNIDQL